MFNEDELIPISALQHVLFCERQYALIHLEQVWEENLFTAQGKILHERVDHFGHETRKSQKMEFSMPIRSLKYGLIGKSDLVELEKDKTGKIVKVVPVEFKRGKNKIDDIDRVQLCAQAMCLEEMLNCNISVGQFYYHQEHRRTSQEITKELREKTVFLVGKIKSILQSKKTPHAEYNNKKCPSCSLVNICMPKLKRESRNVTLYIEEQLRTAFKDTPHEKTT